MRLGWRGAGSSRLEPPRPSERGDPGAELGAGAGGAGVSVGGRRPGAAPLRHPAEPGWAGEGGAEIRAAQSAAAGPSHELCGAPASGSSSRTPAAEVGLGEQAGRGCALGRGLSGSSCDCPVTYPALPESGLRGLRPGGVQGKERSRTCTSDSTLLPHSGISLCALPSGTGIDLTFPNPGSPTSWVQAACLPEARGQGEDGSGSCPLFLHHLPDQSCQHQP